MHEFNCMDLTGSRFHSLLPNDVGWLNNGFIFTRIPFFIETLLMVVSAIIFFLN